MAKAIHWPEAFRDEILAEDETALFCAFRLGRLYYEGHYWTDNEEVDIRCGHKKLRRALVQGSLKCGLLKEVTPAEWSMQKAPLKTLSAAIRYLEATYHQPVSEETEVTLVFYKNLPVIAEDIEPAVEDESGRHF